MLIAGNNRAAELSGLPDEICESFLLLFFKKEDTSLLFPVWIPRGHGGLDPVIRLEMGPPVAYMAGSGEVMNDSPLPRQEIYMARVPTNQVPPLEQIPAKPAPRE